MNRKDEIGGRFGVLCLCFSGFSFWFGFNFVYICVSVAAAAVFIFFFNLSPLERRGIKYIYIYKKNSDLVSAF